MKDFYHLAASQFMTDTSASGGGVEETKDGYAFYFVYSSKEKLLEEIHWAHRIFGDATTWKVQDPHEDMWPDDYVELYIWYEN